MDEPIAEETTTITPETHAKKVVEGFIPFNIHAAPKEQGVYLLRHKEKKEILYIGTSTNIKKRLRILTKENDKIGKHPLRKKLHEKLDWDLEKIKTNLEENYELATIELQDPHMTTQVETLLIKENPKSLNNTVE